MQIFAKIFVFLIVMMFPLYLWSYALTLSDKNSSSRAKFYSWLFSGIFSVGATFFLTDFLKNQNFFVFFAIFFIFLALAYGIIFIFSRFKSRLASTFIARVSLFHIVCLAFIFAIFFFSGKIFFGNFFLSGIFFAIFLNAFLEEISKHFSSLALLGAKFRFSLRDLLIFAFCSAIGFTFVENFLYFFLGNSSGFSLIFRSIFTFSAHLLSAVICTVFWWKSLSYKIFSWKYFLFFIIWFCFAVGVHAIFNFALSSNFLIILLPYLFVSYGSFVYFLQKE